MNQNTQQSKEWRAEQKKLGRVPKLIWPHSEDWPAIQLYLRQLNLQRQIQERGLKWPEIDLKGN